MTLPTYTADWSYMTDAFQNTYILGSGWLLPSILTFVIMILITKDINKWKVMALPLMVIWIIIGIKVHLAILILAGIIFVIEALSTEMGGSILESITEKVNPRYKTKKEIRNKGKRLFDINKVIKKIKVKKPGETYEPMPDSYIRNLFKKNTGEEL